MSEKSFGIKLTVDPFARAVSVAKNLREGDIIRCYMPTDVSKDGNFQIFLRYAMVHGIRINPDTSTPTGLYVSRLAFSTPSFDHTTDIKIRPGNFTIYGRDTKSQSLCLKTKRIDLVPLNVNYFPTPYVNKVGYVSEKLFPLLKSRFKLGQDSNNVEDSPFPTALLSEWIVPSLRSSDHGKLPSFSTDLSWYTPLRENFIAITGTPKPEENNASYVLPETAKPAMDLSWLPSPKKPRERQRGNKTSDPTRKGFVHSPKAKLSDIPPRIPPSEIDTKPSDIAGTYSEPSVDTKPASSDQLQRLVAAFKNPKPTEGASNKAISFGKFANTPVSRFSSVQAFRQQARAKTDLLGQIWQGKYIFANVFSIADPDKEGQAFRPCVIVNAYQDNGNLCGLDLIPCTNDELNQTKWGLPVLPLMTFSKKPGVLMADKLIRLAYNQDNFPQGLNGPFHELSIKKYNQLMELREAAEVRGDVTVIGLSEPPKDWNPVTIDQTPTFQWLQNEGKELGYKCEDSRARSIMAAQYKHYFAAKLG